MGIRSTSGLLLFICVLHLRLVNCQELEKSQCGAGHGQSFFSGANDVVVVKQKDGDLLSTRVDIQVGKFSSPKAAIYSREGKIVSVEVNGEEVTMEDQLVIGHHGVVCFQSGTRNNFSSGELEQMNLIRGKNPGLFTVKDLGVQIKFDVYLMDQKDRLVVTDIDGTITKSDYKGFFLPIFGIDYHQKYVVELFQEIGRNGYSLIYLTARSIALNEETREYLFKKLQNKKGFSLPPGPVLSSAMDLKSALKVKDPSDTKAKTIVDIDDKFDLGNKVVVGAYGNQKSDLDAYLKAGINANLTYIANEQGELTNPIKNSTYKEHYEHVNEMYPPLVRGQTIMPWSIA